MKIHVDAELLVLINSKGTEVAFVRGEVTDWTIQFPPMKYGGSLSGATLWIGKHQAHDILGNVVNPQDIRTRHGLWSAIPYLTEPTVREMYYGDRADEYA